MPDDERLGGTRDPHEYGRRHRREEGEEPPRRRRRSMESGGGLSVADLVQKHTGSRPDLTPVDPSVPLSQNTLMHGRRSLETRHPGGIAEAGGPAPTDEAGRGPTDSLRNGFPAVEAPHRRGEAHHAVPSEPEPGLPKRGSRRASESSAPRNTFFAEQDPAPPGGFFTEAAPANGFFTEQPPAEPSGRRPGEASAPRTSFPGEAAPKRARGISPAPSGLPKRGHRGETPADEPNGFTPEPSRGHHLPTPGDAPEPRGRRGESSAHLPAPAAPNGFTPEPTPRSRRGESSTRLPVPDSLGFPTENPPRGHRGESSTHLPIPGEPGGFPAETPKRGRRAKPADDEARFPGTDPNGFPAETPKKRGGDPNGFPPAAESTGLPKRGRKAPAPAEGDPNGFPAGMGAPRGVGDPGIDGPRRGRRPGESSVHLPIPTDGFPTAAGAPRGVGDASMPGQNGFPPETRRGPRPGENSVRLPAPDAGARRTPPQPPIGQFPVDGTGQFPVDAPRRPGQASGRFPTDDPRRQGPPTPLPANRQGPPTPPPANRQGPPANRQGPPTPLPANRPPLPGPAEPMSEPRLTPAAIDAPDTRRSTGVPPVPMMPPVNRGDDDPISMTTEMEAIGEEVQKRRSIDHTLARFSAVHDELKAEERVKKAKRRKLMPWQSDDDEMAALDELDAQQSMAMQIPVVPREPDPEAEAEAEEDDPRGKKKKKKKRKLKGKFAGKVFTAIVAGMVFASTAAAWGFKSYIEASAQTVDALDPDSKAIQDAAAQRGDENFLLVGSDTRAGATAEEGVGDENEVIGARSDTVMIAHIPKDRQRVVVVSFPRDLEVTRPACEGWDPKTGEYNGTQHPPEKLVKINTAYQVGGPKCVTKMVQELSGLAVNHFVGIDFHGFKDMVDAVQGVEVCVERPLKDSVLGTVVPEAGKAVRLTGDQALNFVRARHVQGDVTSDYGRITRQQRFLSSLLRKAMSGEVLLNPGKLTDFVDAFSKATFGDNIGVDQLFTLGQSMQGIEAGRVTFITVPTVGTANKRGNEELRVEDTNALFEAIRQDTPLPGETPVRDDASQANKQKASSLMQDQPAGSVDPKTIKVQVLNGGNEQGGIARDTADELAELGFQIIRFGAAPENVDTTVIRYSKSREAQAQALKAAVPGATLREDASMSGAIMLILGPDFDGKVVSPNGGGGETAEIPDGLSTVNAGDVSCA